MRLRNATTEASWVRKHWLEQFGDRPEFRGAAEALRALPDDPTPDAVDAAFAEAKERCNGNRVLREFECHECKAVVPHVVEVGEEPDHEDSHTAHLCPACLFDAVRLMDGE